VNRGTPKFIAAVAAILSLAIAGYLVILGDPPNDALTTAVPQAQPTNRAIVARADGTVEIRLGNGKWAPAEIGNEVDAIRTTGATAKAALTYGDSIKVNVIGDTQVRLETIGPNIARFVVGEEGGVVIADVDPASGQRIQLKAEGSDAITETTDGRVHLLSDGAGTVQTAVTRGEATVTAQGKTVRLTSDQQSVVRPGQSPEAPTPIPKSLLLKVKWPQTITTKRRHLLSGKTNPNARLRVGTRLVSADAKGNFKILVELKEGQNQLDIAAIDVLGRAQKIASPQILVDSQGPAHAVETNPDMWKRSKPAEKP